MDYERGFDLMKLPSDPAERADVEQAIRLLQTNRPFARIVAWLESELKKRDVENRNPEWANKTSEAQGLAGLLEIIAACHAPAADRDSSDAGAKEESAQPLI